MTYINIHSWHPLVYKEELGWVYSLSSCCHRVCGTSLIEINFGRLNNWALLIIKPCRLITHNWRLGLSGLAASILQYLILAAWEEDFWADSSLVCVPHLLTHSHLDSEQVGLTLKQCEWLDSSLVSVSHLLTHFHFVDGSMESSMTESIMTS